MALDRLTLDMIAEITALIANINLPGMSRIELVTRAKAIRPTMPVIMIPGDDDLANVSRTMGSEPGRSCVSR